MIKQEALILSRRRRRRCRDCVATAGAQDAIGNKTGRWVPGSAELRNEETMFATAMATPCFFVALRAEPYRAPLAQEAQERKQSTKAILCIRCPWRIIYDAL